MISSYILGVHCTYNYKIVYCVRTDSLVQEAVLAGLAVLEVLAVLRACVQKTEIQKFLPIHWGSALVGLLIVYLIFVSHHD